MDRIGKVLKRLSPKERAAVANVLALLLSHTIRRLDIKKLKGFDDVFRVRIQNLRIIYKKMGSDIRVLEISRRSDQTYKKF